MKISYDKQFKDQIITKAGFKVGKDGYLLDAKTNKPVKDINGDFITRTQFSGFSKGSINLVKADLPSLIKLSKKLRA